MVKDLLKVGFDDDTGQYVVNIPQGSSLEETAFCVSVVAKCLARDKIVKNENAFIKKVKHYCTDPQFDEVKEKGEEKCEEQLHL